VYLALVDCEFKSHTSHLLPALRDAHNISGVPVIGMLMRSVVRLRNSRLPDLEPVEVAALADSGAVHLCIPEWVRIQLKLQAIE